MTVTKIEIFKNWLYSKQPSLKINDTYTTISRTQERKNNWIKINRK